MTIKELIEKLKNLPEDQLNLIVYCIDSDDEYYKELDEIILINATGKYDPKPPFILLT
jgi:hypothetical protein